MFERIWHILIKDLIELRRDRWARFRLIVPPLIQMLIFGYAATFEVSHVSTVILDQEHSQESRELISDFTAGDRFMIVKFAKDPADVAKAIDDGTATVAITIQPRFSESLRNRVGAPVQVSVDGTNSNTALIALGYVSQIVGSYSQKYSIDLANRIAPQLLLREPQIELEQRPWYNPDLNDRWFFVPGVIATLTLTLVVNLTAFAIVREREAGTLEQILVSPIRPIEFILGKTLPFYLVGLAEVGLVTLFGVLWFHVPFAGDPFVLLAGTSLFLLSTLALGLLISTVCTTQQQAFATNFFVVNPLFILSGFAFPIAGMPRLLQWFTYINPLHYFLVILRALFLKGVGLTYLWTDFAALAALGTVLLTGAVLRFRKTLD